jgi:hypothetical protein
MRFICESFSQFQHLQHKILQCTTINHVKPRTKCPRTARAAARATAAQSLQHFKVTRPRGILKGIFG